MRHQTKSLFLLHASFRTDRVSLTLFLTIDMPRFAGLWPGTQNAGTQSEANKEQRSTNYVRWNLCSVNGRSCRRSSCTPAELYPPHEHTNFIMLTGRVFDARNCSYQPLVGAILTREWARFRLTKTIIFPKLNIMYMNDVIIFITCFSF